MNRSIVWTTQFKKDYKLALKRNLDIELLDNIIRSLSGRIWHSLCWAQSPVSA